MRVAQSIYFFSATVRFFSALAAKQWLVVYSQGILMILSPYLFKFTVQQSSDWHMVVSQEKTVRLGSRSMLTLWRYLWKELIKSDLCIPSQYGFSLDVVLSPHRVQGALLKVRLGRGWRLHSLWVLGAQTLVFLCRSSSPEELGCQGKALSLDVAV